MSEAMDLQSERMKRLQEMEDMSKRLLAMVGDEKIFLEEEMIREKKTDAELPYESSSNDDVDTDAPDAQYGTLKTAVQILEEKKQQRQVTMETEEYQRAGTGLWICRLSVNGKGFKSIAPRKKDAY
jgi:hypothetical protein